MGLLKRRIIEAMEPKEEPPMGHMKDLLIRIRSGSDESIIEALDELLPRWIPVSERLPEDKEQCLVARGEDVAVAWWHSRPQEFIHEDIDNAWTPTHWMPLPEPPA
jgi:hypothetical protein